jgi:glycosyltransferase involved in cell wall biosynthesis
MARIFLIAFLNIAGELFFYPDPKPVVATSRVAAAHDLIKQGINGFIVSENDVQALAKAIDRIISDEELAKRMGQKSREIIVQGFTYEHMAGGFKQAIEYCRYK